MNSKKHRNKSRAKVLPTPPQELNNAEAVNAIRNVQLGKNLECSSKSEDIKQNFPVDLKTEFKVRDENDQVKESLSEEISLNVEQIPVKPKRNKGKKKKRNTNEVSSENFSDDNKKTELVDNKVINLIETNQTDLINQENIDVQPSTRKKKNKSKKLCTMSQEFLAEIESNTEDISLEQINFGVEGDDQFIVQSANKKNKKKKRRYDSEKSEKADEKLSCIAAFNELNSLRDPGEVDEQDQEIYNDNIINCAKNQTEESFKGDLGNGVVCVTKKKKKEEKKHPPKSEQCNQYDIQIRNAVEEVTNTDNFQNVTTVEKAQLTRNIPSVLNDTTLQCIITNEPTQRATIAKPVKNKTAGISDKYEDMVKAEKKVCYVSSDINKTLDIKMENEQDSPLSAELANDSQLKSSLPDITFQNPEDIKFSDEKLDAFECFKTSGDTRKLNDNDFVPLLENTEQNIQTVNDELDFKILTKNDTDSVKLQEEIPLADTKLNEEPRIDCSKRENIKEEDHKTIQSNKICDNTPDFIQIPRSSSQQLFADNNNNTIIHEITSNDEIKLGIPVLTSNIIQGSGETPVSTPKIKSDDVSFTEIESIPDKDQEKTDLKSKMLEVNHDLEELKLSLEKSLAELTVIEKNEEEIDNKPCSILEADTENICTIVEDRTVDETITYKPLADRLNDIENRYISIEENQSEQADNTLKQQSNNDNVPDFPHVRMTPPICPSRKDRKGKGKSKKNSRSMPEQPTSQIKSASSETKSDESKNDNKNEKNIKTEEKGKQKSANGNRQHDSTGLDFEPIENFEDALTSSVDDADVTKTFEIIAHELNSTSQTDQAQKESTLNKPEINITPPTEDNDKEKQQQKVHPVSQPKNLLGHCTSPVPSSKTDYKKEKNKTPNAKHAKVKIKDAVEPDTGSASCKMSTQSQTENRIKLTKNKNEIESFSYVTNENEEYVYKYSFRRVYLGSACHVCRRELGRARPPCKYCSLLFYCSQKHKDEDWPRHQSLCFAVSTVVHLKDQKHIYSDAKNLSGQNYRLIRMQMILSCEKVLNRKLLPWEQEALLYPRICADIQCREWKQSKLRDCDRCGQVSYCIENPQHLPASHQRWCKSYALYQKLVLYQELNGRLEPKLPGKVIADEYILPGKINEVLASMYNEKIDMTEIQYAALTQVATAPLTTAFCYQTFRHWLNCSNRLTKKSTFTVHVVGADLQFEADSLNKWEVFLLHLKPDVQVLRVEFVGHELNPSNLPLDLLGKVNQCAYCRESNRRVQISFQDKPYKEYWSGDEFIVPDIVCAFNPSIQRSSTHGGGDSWPTAINCILKQKVPFLITSHTLEELGRDLENIKDCADVNYKVVAEPEHNPFASFRPDRNFITDEETPLLFKNYCFSILCGV